VNGNSNNELLFAKEETQSMEEISGLYAFLKVVEKASFTAAASDLNCSTSSISKRITQLEHVLGAKLLNRSTHGMANLTEAGAAYFERVRKIIYELESAKESIKDIAQSLQGTLKVHMTPGTGIRLALPAILQFMKTYPSLSVEISVQPHAYDILRQGFDVSIRSVGVNEPDINYATIQARELVKAQYIICASPSYFERYGKPSHPRELAKHNCLVSARQPSSHKWWFRNGHKKFAVKVQGTLLADNWAVVYEAAKAGMGIARMLCINPALELSRDLQPVFSDMVVSDRSVWALVPRMQPLPRKIEVFLSFLTEELRQQSRT
jgi:DNA-binding transcriptional LysR family regulator